MRLKYFGRPRQDHSSRYIVNIKLPIIRTFQYISSKSEYDVLEILLICQCIGIITLGQINIFISNINYISLTFSSNMKGSIFPSLLTLKPYRNYFEPLLLMNSFSRKRSKDTVINRLLCRINLNSFSNYYIAIFLYENISMKLFLLFDILLGVCR
jgi:hypothetical protein